MKRFLRHATGLRKAAAINLGCARGEEQPLQRGRSIAIRQLLIQLFLNRSFLLTLPCLRLQSGYLNLLTRSPRQLLQY